MKIIIWNEFAKIDFQENIDFLLKKWSEREALNFIEDVETVLYDLKSGKVDFQEAEYQDIKKCIVCKQITLYYRHVTENEIEVMRFWNNYQDKKKLSL